MKRQSLEHELRWNTFLFSYMIFLLFGMSGLNDTIIFFFSIFSDCMLNTSLVSEDNKVSSFGSFIKVLKQWESSVLESY